MKWITPAIPKNVTCAGGGVVGVLIPCKSAFIHKGTQSSAPQMTFIRALAWFRHVQSTWIQHMREIKSLVWVKLPQEVEYCNLPLAYSVQGAQVQPKWPPLSQSGLKGSNSPKCSASQVLERAYGHRFLRSWHLVVWNSIEPIYSTYFRHNNETHTIH